MADFTFIYALADPRDGRVRYVGKSNRPYKRRNSHVFHALRHGLMFRWIEDLNRAGCRPRVLILEAIPVAGWQERERWWIAALRSAGRELLNVCSGGNGLTTHCAETREALRRKFTGRVVSAETREKNRAAHLGMKHSDHAKERVGAFWRGRRRSDANRANLSAAKKGKPIPDHVRAASVAARRARAKPPRPPESPEARATRIEAARIRLTRANTGRAMPAHVMEALRQANVGRPTWNKGRKLGPSWNKGKAFSTATRAKMSASKRALHARRLVARLSLPILSPAF